MLSNTCKYGIRALVYMAVNSEKNDRIGIKQISDDLAIPSPFLGKIMQLLAKYKILNSYKGPNGGFVFAKDPNEINMLEIVNIIDGLDSFVECFMGLKICEGKIENKEKCPLHKKSGVLRDHIFEVFEKTSIGDIAKDIKETNKSDKEKWLV